MDCVTCDRSTSCLAGDQRRYFKLPERLVGVGLRCWLAGYETCDIHCWEAGWEIFADKLGADNAKRAIAELSCWTRALCTESSRKINYYPFFHPFDCIEFCDDECTAIRMIAAYQQHSTEIEADCLRALTGSGDSSATDDAGRSFAKVLSDADIYLDRRILTGMSSPDRQVPMS